MKRYVLSLMVIMLLAGFAVAAPVDPLMGDWEGEYESQWGDQGEFVAQIIALGDGNYRMQILSEFDVRQVPSNVFNAKLVDGKVMFRDEGDDFTGGGQVKDVVFKGEFKGEDDGEFVMRRVVRLSPTLGKKPPKGAVVLFGGKDLSQWQRMGGSLGLVDLAKEIGGDNSVAYIGTFISSETAQKAILEIGSDDGVKVWLNQEVVHTKKASRGVTPGEDKVAVQLKEGGNSLMLKVANGSGGWGACVRIADEEGKALSGISEIKEEYGEWSGTDEYLKKNRGFLTVWWKCGPYKEEGKAGLDLLDVEMEPESLGMDAPWEPITPMSDPELPKWVVKDGVMEVRAGSIMTKNKSFTDFRLHVEFKSPFMPSARGQGRGNSGVYLQNRYEVQVLDSYGLEGEDNECGGVYKVGKPLVNMCAPPGQWQSYDIEFKAPKCDKSGQKLEDGDASLTVVHNGVTIHDKLRIPGITGGAMNGDIDEPGGIYLQDHGNPVQFRNMWIVDTSGK